MSRIVLSVSKVNKSFKLPTEQASGIKQAFINWARGIKGYKKQEVLRDIDFEIEEGDFFGIVGRNGSGKSTLLKLVSGIYHPDSGDIEVNGSLVPFIELGVGFNPELTGRENVYLNGAMLGFSVKQIDDMYDDIVDFAELHEFMDQKLKNYSSGMQVRLAFSVAIKAQGDILVLDEVLAVGDEAFQRKCYNHFAKMKKEHKTVVLVTHDMESVQRFCNKAILINKGRIELAGSAPKVAQLYRDLNDTSSVSADEANGIKRNRLLEKIDVDVRVNTTPTNCFFSTTITANTAITDAVVTFVIRGDTGEWVYRYATDDDNSGSFAMQHGQQMCIDLDLDNVFADGVYYVDVSVKKYDRTETYVAMDEIAKFEINHKKDSKYWQIPTSVDVSIK